MPVAPLLRASACFAQRGPDPFTEVRASVALWRALACACLLLLAGVATAQTTALEVRVVASADDAEQAADSTMSLSSSDLELIHDTTDQTVGMRWIGLDIPRGATITAAWIQFTAKSSASAATSLTFRAQAADAAPAFTSSRYNIGARTRTTAAVTWAPPAWTSGQAGAGQRTPDLKALVQEVVNRAGWAPNNPLVIIVNGTGLRTAFAWNGSAPQAALLHVEYAGLPPEQPPVAQLGVTVAASPPLTVNASAVGSSDIDATPIASYSFTFGDGTPAVVVNAPAQTASHTYAAAGTYTVTLVATDTGGLTSAPKAASITVQAPTSGTVVEKRVAASSDDAEQKLSGSMSLTSSDLELIHDSSDQLVGMRWTGLAIPPGATIGAAWIQFASKELQSEVTNLTLKAQAADNAATFTTTASDIAVRPLTAASVAWAPVPWSLGEAGFNQRTPDLKALVQEVVSRGGWANGNALAIVVSGTGHRTAFAWDGGSTQAPLLHVEYSTDGSPPPGPPADLPPVAQLALSLAASPPLTVNASAAGSTDGDATPIASYAFDFGDGSPVVVVTAPAQAASHTYAAAGTYTVTLVATDTGALTSTPVTSSLTLTASTGLTTVERRVAASADDAEQTLTGSMSLSSSDLELIHDSSDQVVGMRWTGLAIPPGATIQTAWVQFASKELQSEVTNLTLRAQAADNAAAFTSTASNISSRALTTAAAAWAPVAWAVGEAGSKQRTPELRTLVQEVVSRPGWASGNALAVVVSGTGHRTAYAWDGSSTLAALLHVEYTNDGTPPPAPPADQPPLAQLALSQPITPSLSVTANAAGSTDGDATPIASYSFDFGDGTQKVVVNEPTKTASHAYASAGTYTVTLTATDTGGLTSAPVTASITVSAPTGGAPIAVYVGYYDTHHSGLTQAKPNPWEGSSGVVFVGKADDSSYNWDSSALRVDNLTGSDMTGVVVTCDIGSKNYSLWGTRSIPANGKLILAQTGYQNFDGSDTSPAGCYGCDPSLCLTKVVSTIPVIHVTVGGVTTNYYDNTQVLNTKGADGAGCPYTGTRNDESQQWKQIGTARALVAGSPDENGDWIPEKLTFDAPAPNPMREMVLLRFTLPKASHVVVGFYDVAGRLVSTSLDRDMPAGIFQQGVELRGVNPGVYYCRVQTSYGSLQRSVVVSR